jgi:hypothetical protein
MDYIDGEFAAPSFVDTGPVISATDPQFVSEAVLADYKAGDARTRDAYSQIVRNIRCRVDNQGEFGEIGIYSTVTAVVQLTGTAVTFAWNAFDVTGTGCSLSSTFEIGTLAPPSLLYGTFEYSISGDPAMYTGKIFINPIGIMGFGANDHERWYFTDHASGMYTIHAGSMSWNIPGPP